MSFKFTIGSSRRSQAIFNYGTGAIIDFIHGSFMPLSLNYFEMLWNNLPKEEKDSLLIYEPRLQKILKMKEFRNIPVPKEGHISEYGDKVKREWTIPCTRFPKWHVCPKCNRLGKPNDPFEEEPDGKLKCLKCDKPVTPVRFIVACTKGHIDEFPWYLWVHSKKGSNCNNPKLYLKSKGKTASLGDLFVYCSSCKESRDLHDIFHSYALKGLKCKGSRPWNYSHEGCSERLNTLQRGGSNVHFPIIASMLSIPPASESIAKILENEMNWINSIDESVRDAAVRSFLIKNNPEIDPDVGVEWTKRRAKIDTDEFLVDESAARYQEYEALCNETSFDLNNEFENYPISIDGRLKKWFQSFSAVKRLREVRAYCGFSRIQPFGVAIENINDAVNKKMICSIAENPVDWRPAIQIHGEGIFFKLNEEEIQNWIKNENVNERVDLINKLNEDFLEKHDLEPPYRITPRLMLIHSLSHILIRRLALDCGYSSASLRERLYISDGDETTPVMSGILIYTATPGSDGTLGGLVNLATSTNINNLIEKAIQDAQWCGNDPVCSETEPYSNGERLIGACCHNCLLLPETACEKFNRELDRVLLIGSSETESTKRIPGFFDINE